MGLKYFVLIFSIVLFQNVYSTKDQITLDREDELKNLMYEAADACADFYSYACLSHDEIFPMPNYRGKFDNADRMTEENYVVLDRLLRENIEKLLQKEPTTDEEKAKVFYSMCNNMTEINNQGNGPLLKTLNLLASFPGADDHGFENPYFNRITFISAIHATLYKNPFFTERFILREPTNVTNRIIPGFLSSRSSIGRTDGEKDKIRSILKEIGFNETRVNNTFNDYYKFYDNLEALDSFKNGNKLTATISEFEKLIPLFKWKEFLSGVYLINFNETDLIYVDNVEYFKNLTNLLYKTEPSTIANYGLINFIDGLLPVLPDGFLKIRNKYNEATHKYNTTMPRWRQCIDIVVEVMNIPTAQIFIRGSNYSENRDNIQQMVDNLKSVYVKFLQNSSWPGTHLKKKSIEKLNAFQVDLSWENLINESSKKDRRYEDVFINQNSFFDTYIGINWVAHDLSKLYVDQNPDIWVSSLVSAKSLTIPELNKFSMSPGLVKPPFYYAKYPKAFQFGSLGVAIAQAMFHSFDTLGASYNAQGFLENWWSGKDYEEFQNRSKCFKDQYDSYELYRVYLNNRPGDYENIADNTALKIAYTAYDEFLKNNPQSEKEEIVNECFLSSRQLFFVAMAQQLCSKVRSDSAIVKHYMETDPYATGRYRIMGMVENSEDLRREFHCSRFSPIAHIKKCNFYS